MFDPLFESFLQVRRQLRIPPDPVSVDPVRKKPKMRNKLRFSKHTHRDYYRRKDIVDAVFKEFLKPIYRGFYAEKSRNYGVPPRH